MNRKLLGIYLNDHLAGSVVGTRLARRIAKHNEGNHYGSEASRLAEEIQQDKATLEALMERLDVRRKKLRLAAAAVAETAGRLKPNGRMVGYSRLSWGIDPEQLISRADDQRRRVRDPSPAGGSRGLQQRRFVGAACQRPGFDRHVDH